MYITNNYCICLSADEHIFVPNELIEELVGLRTAFGWFLYKYEMEFQSNTKAQEVFVGATKRMLTTGIVSDHSFQHYFEKLIEEEVSLFNITHMKQICDYLPDDIR